MNIKKMTGLLHDLRAWLVGTVETAKIHESELTHIGEVHEALEYVDKLLELLEGGEQGATHRKLDKVKDLSPTEALKRIMYAARVVADGRYSHDGCVRLREALAVCPDVDALVAAIRDAAYEEAAEVVERVAWIGRDMADEIRTLKKGGSDGE